MVLLSLTESGWFWKDFILYVTDITYFCKGRKTGGFIECKSLRFEVKVCSRVINRFKSSHFERK